MEPHTPYQLMRIASRVFQEERASLQATFAALDDKTFHRAVHTLARAGRIATCGCGHSGIACMHFAHSLCCIGRPARFLAPSEASHGGMGFLQEGDVLVLASRGGMTDELLPLISICRAKGACIIAVTERADSPLAAGADLVLPLRITAEADRDNSQGTSSFAALAAVFDALQCALLEVTGFRSAQFALIHPGGAVGKRLNRIAAEERK